MSRKRVLIVYYSFSGQTQVLVQRLATGLRENDIEVCKEKLHTVRDISFPFGSWIQMVEIMVVSFFQKRFRIKSITTTENANWDFVILAGPTWSYSPSGPILEFIDRHGEELLSGKKVLPIISCRTYWKFHYWTLKFLLDKKGANVQKPTVFSHPVGEPWRTIGLVLQLLGRLPRLEDSWFRKKYPRYGHSKAQYDLALEEGRRIGKYLAEEKDLC